VLKAFVSRTAAFGDWGSELGGIAKEDSILGMEADASPTCLCKRVACNTALCALLIRGALCDEQT
jgi:hypothetical protein